MATNVCLSCDSVFDTLTRGPYPNGEANEDVDRHLAACHDCRQLAEALRPATELFHEAMAKEVAATLPVFRAELPELKVAHDVIPRGGRSSLWLRMIVCAACLLIGCAAGFGIRNESTSRDASHVIVGANPMPTMTFATLSRLPLSQECRQQFAGAELPGNAELKSDLACCTRCHKSPAAGGVHTEACWTTTIASSCLACHSATPTL